MLWPNAQPRFSRMFRRRQLNNAVCHAAQALPERVSLPRTMSPASTATSMLRCPGHADIGTGYAGIGHAVADHPGPGPAVTPVR